MAEEEEEWELVEEELSLEYGSGDGRMVFTNGFWEVEIKGYKIPNTLWEKMFIPRRTKAYLSILPFKRGEKELPYAGAWEEGGFHMSWLATVRGKTYEVEVFGVRIPEGFEEYEVEEILIEEFKDSKAVVRYLR